MATVLLVDDEHDVLGGWRDALTAAGHAVIAVRSAGDAVVAFASAEVDVVLAHVTHAGMSGSELCAHVVGQRPDVPVVLVTSDSKVETAIQAIRAGAHDYLLKPFALPTLLIAVERAAQHRALQKQIKQLRHEPSSERGQRPSAYSAGSATATEDGELPTLREVVRRHIARVLSVTSNNKTTAARILGIDRKTLYRKLEEDDATGAPLEAD